MQLGKSERCREPAPAVVVIAEERYFEKPLLDWQLWRLKEHLCPHVFAAAAA
jgi:hypothetical protein